jgi:hypothetical protein
MAQIRIEGLVAKASKTRGTSWYWQPSATLKKAGWKPIALGKDQTSAIKVAQQRNAEVEAWKAGGNPSLVTTAKGVAARIQSGTVSALIARYRKDVVNGKHPSTQAPLLRPKTKEAYETGLKRIEAWAGKHPIAYVTPARIKVLRDVNALPPEQGGIGHSATFNLLKTLRQLFEFAESCDLLPKGSNPARKFNLGAPPPRAQVWEADDEAAFIAAAYDLNLPSLALAVELAIYSGQREGDLLAFTEAQLRPLEIHNALVRARFADADGCVMGWSLEQLKTSDAYSRTLMDIPLEAGLRQKVERAIAANRARDRAATPRRLLTHVLVDDRTGLPWKKRAFIDAWRSVLTHAAKATGRAHMTGLVWHDLRRTRVVRLRRRGMDPSMIASITGHSPASITMMLKVYGPVDPTITAAAIASDLPALPVAPKPEAQEQSA